MRKFRSGLVGWSLSLFFCVFSELALSAEVSDFREHLPVWIRSEIFARLKEIPFDETTLKEHKSVLYASGQSIVAKRGATLNRTHFFEGDRFDVWLMRQHKAPTQFDFKKWHLVSIVVDKKPSVPISYYLSYGYPDPGKGEIPKPTMPEDRCYTCHPSGPRKIRPGDTRFLPPLSKETVELIADWNDAIEAYEVVDTYKPVYRKSDGTYFGIHDFSKHAMEEVKMGACTDCHSKDGIRNVLRRQHVESIMALIRYNQSDHGYWQFASKKRSAAMPPDDILGSQQYLKLKDWLEKKPAK